MARKERPFTYRIFVGNKKDGYSRLEDRTPEEQEKFRNSLIPRMGEALNDYFSCHPDEYGPVMEAVGARDA